MQIESDIVVGSAVFVICINTAIKLSLYKNPFSFVIDIIVSKFNIWLNSFIIENQQKPT